MSTLWKSRYALRTLGIKSSAIRELLKVTQRPEIISFGGGLPAPDVFPVQRFQEACRKVLAEQGRSPAIWRDRRLRAIARDDRAKHGALRNPL